MKTATTLIITLLALASAQASAAPASGDSSLTGVPMSAAKRLSNAPVPSVELTGTKTTGVPMFRVTRLLGSQFVTAPAGAGTTAVPLSGVPMVRAKRP